MNSIIDRRDILKGLGAAGALAAWPGAGAFAQGAPKFRYSETEGYHWVVPYVCSGIDGWRKAGLDPQITVFTTGRLGLEAMLSGQTDFAISTDTPFIYAAMRGLRPMVVAAYSRSTGGAPICVRNDRIKTPQDFKGKTIATPTGAGGHFYLTRYLDFHKIALREVKIINMSPADGINALVRGDVDALSWDRGASNAAVERGQGKISIVDTSEAEKYFRQHCLMIANEKIVKEQPETCRLVVRALKSAVDFMKTNQEKVIEIVAARTKTSAAETKIGVADFDPVMLFDDLLLRDMAVQSEWAFENKLAQRPSGGPDMAAFYRSHLHFEGMRAEVPGGVKL
ncbi:MAG: hypothetical protein FJX52_10875 [Alphaproteobacteria bacterium]|nr:hypothetical protein [Alphaproteobacteria bacterium]